MSKKQHAVPGTTRPYEGDCDPVLEASISELVGEYQEDEALDGYYKDGPLTRDDLKNGNVGGRWNVANDEAPVDAFVHSSGPLTWVRISGTEYAFVTHIEIVGEFTGKTEAELKKTLDDIEVENGVRPLLRDMPSEESIQVAKQMIEAEPVAS